MLLKNTDISEATQFDNTLVCFVGADSNEEQKAHACWYLGFMEGELLPDCGVYYTALGKAAASQEDERKILSNPAGFALCMVTLEHMEANT